MNNLDTRLFRAMNRLADRTSWAHGPVVAYAKVGVVAFAILLLIGWWQARVQGDLDQMARLLWAGVGTLVAVGLNQIVGSVVARARPYNALPNVHLLISRTADFSFPSDHAVAAGAVAAGLMLAHRRLGAVAVALALAMGGARVYVGAHYPGDVVAGLILGAVIVVAAGQLGVPLLRALTGAIDRSPLRPVVSAPLAAEGHPA